MSKFLWVVLVGITGFAASLQAQDLKLANEYFVSGEYHKAEVYYDKISKDQGAIASIYENYLQTLFYLQDFDKATKFCKKAIKSDGNNFSYKVDLGIISYKQNKKDEAEKYFEKLINTVPNGDFFVKQTAERFIKYNLNNYAEQTYLTAREKSGDPKGFYFELTSIYFRNNKKKELTDHLLTGLDNNWVALGYVQNTFQQVYEPQDYDTLELRLLDMVQQEGNSFTVNDLLIWLYYQKKDFANALFQAKAYDRKRKLEGEKVLEVGNLCMKNEEFQIASEAFQYIIDKYPKSPHYREARRQIVQTKEELVKNVYPVDTQQIRSLISDYQKILDEFGLIYANAGLLKRMAVLHAFYLDEKEEAIKLLDQLNKVRNITTELRAEAKLVKGDIYVLKNEPWEAILIYGQVEKENEFSTIAHEAKFKGAKLSYYIGEFDLAKSHLGILKEATTKEIANDAIDLSVFIMDNSGLDTSYAALSEYAQIELLIYQHKLDDAYGRLDKMLMDYPNHSLTDEIYWKQSELKIRMGQYEAAVALLKKIEEGFSTDILGDDAVFKIGEIYDFKTKDKNNAREYYKKILLDYSGSIYVNEARKRFRKLRGDFN